MSKFSYGLMPDRHDDRDLRFSRLANQFGLVALPAQASLRLQQSAVRDQLKLGACTGFALTGLDESLRLLASLPAPMLSPLWLYYFERRKEHSVGIDAGARIRDGLKILRSRGCAPDTDWPYVPSLFTQVPPAIAQTDARPYQIDAYHRVNNLLELKQALALTRTPVVLGILVFSSLEGPDVERTGVVPLPNQDQEELLGGHAILAVEYDDVLQRVTFKNSWGTTWGDAGYGYLPYRYFDPRFDLVMDLWTATL